MKNCGCLDNEECSKCDIYMRDPRAKSIEGFIAALEIFSRYAKSGKNEKYFLEVSHNEVNCRIGVPKDSDDGRRLCTLGWHLDEDESWRYWT